MLDLARKHPAPSVTLVEGRRADGHADGAPYDLVVIEGAVRDIPEAVARQVSANGRLVAIVSPPGGTSVGVLAEPSTGGLRSRAMFDANAPLLPSLAPALGFTF